MFGRRAAQGVMFGVATALAWLIAVGTADAGDPDVFPLATLVNGAVTDFPDGVEFHLMFAGVVEPRRVDLEIGVDAAHSCDGGAVHSVTFAPRTTIIWRWEPDQGLVIPPGHAVWWRWRVVGADGAVRVTRPREFVWEDGRFAWESYRKGGITVRWHDRYPEFGEHLVGFWDSQLERIRAIERGPSAIKVFVYGNALDAGPGAEPVRDANPYRVFNTVVSVIPEEFEGEELTALTHELAHLIVQERGFNCFNGLPQWLEEGLAMVAEGGPSSEMRQAFAEARLIEQLVPLHGFEASVAFGERGSLLRYAQSHSLVQFLMGEFGWERIGVLLDVFRDGVTVDDALKTVFGMDTGEIELLWRLRAGLPDLGPNRVLVGGESGG